MYVHVFQWKIIVQVPLGIIMKNENKTDEMVSILSQMHQYVPKQSERKTIHIPCTGDTEVVVSENLHHLLIGGDQLTSERIRGAQSLRQNSTTPTGRLDGFVPVSEDWHAKVCFMQVCLFLTIFCIIYAY